jgi:hypothetical protein
VINMNVLLFKVFGLIATAPDRLRDHASGPRERGDIPGWVMIAIMSAAVVVVLIPLVGPKIGDAFSNAVDSVSNTKSNSGQ